MIRGLSPEVVKKRRQEAAISSLQATFYFVSGLSSAGYVVYILVYYDLIVRVSGSARIALLILAGSLFLEAVFEIPTGAFADRFGHHIAVRWSFIALIFHALAYFGAALLVNLNSTGSRYIEYPLIIGGEVLAALGLALQNGALNSWFVTHIRHEGYSGRLTTFMARRRFATNLAWLVVGLFFLVLKPGEAEHSSTRYMPWAFFFGAFCYFAAFLVTVKLVTGPGKDVSDRLSLSFIYRIIKDEFYGALGEIMRNRKLLIVGITHSIFWTLSILQTYFWRPLLGFKEDMAGYKYAYYQGVIWLFFVIGQIIGSESASRVKVHEANKRDRRVLFFNMGQFLLAVPILIISRIRLGSDTSLSVLMLAAILLAISRIGRELSKPITMAWTHEEIQSERYRATIDSLIEASAGFIIVLTVIPIKLLSVGKETAMHSDDLLRIVTTVLACATLFLNIPLAWFVMRIKGDARKDQALNH